MTQSHNPLKITKMTEIPDFSSPTFLPPFLTKSTANDWNATQIIINDENAIKTYFNDENARLFLPQPVKIIKIMKMPHFFVN